MCIRGIDYCPPVDLQLGEFLRAVITADRELVPDDKWAYREAWIDAFRDRGIQPREVAALDEAAVVWKPPIKKPKPVQELSFSKLRFKGDPGRPADAKELLRQACALGAVISEPSCIEDFGLKQPSAGVISEPRIESIRSARRIGPDGQVLFDIVAEISQRHVLSSKNSRPCVFYGGSTVILGPEGDIRYVIGTGVKSPLREDSQAEFIESEIGQRYWDGEVRKPIPNVLKILHEGRSRDG
jgi:hypothetical protein